MHGINSRCIDLGLGVWFDVNTQITHTNNVHKNISTVQNWFVCTQKSCPEILKFLNCSL